MRAARIGELGRPKDEGDVVVVVDVETTTVDDVDPSGDVTQGVGVGQGEGVQGEGVGKGDEVN
ncbi:MAG: hypothetical protein EAZ93_24485 [Oscillatoriales cyanobacterium]|nr:MAG: hypothetical protein EAZ93_24485 [Oscillatoriales cyanobacterium]TAF85029.1 MAG: hypothetical protein EAZ49_27715 [Oscillatoriales cyanobacterium]